MSIHFPNASRSYDATRHLVRFWGHDSAMERAFFISAPALQRIQPDVVMEEEPLLRAFDRHRARICQVAAQVYGRGGRSYYALEASDF